MKCYELYSEWVRLVSYAPFFQISISKEGKEEEIGGFCTDGIFVLKDYGSFELNSVFAYIIRKMNFFLGMDLGRQQQGIVDVLQVKEENETFGLGYEPTEKERAKWKINAKELRLYRKTLNGRFIKAGVTSPIFDSYNPRSKNH